MPPVVRRHPKIALLVALLIVAAGVWSATAMRTMWFAGGNKILENHAASMTTYLPSAATPVQDIRPHVGQRGVGIDGVLRGGTAFGLAIQGNPFENAWSGGPATNGPVELSLGAYRASDVDISLPAPGFRWNIGRTYNSAQEDDTPSHRDSDGYQGKNWHQLSQPEIVLYEHPTDDDQDVLYLVYGAERFLEFARVDIEEGTSDTFKGVNGAAGVFLYEEGETDEPDTYTYTDQHGTEAVFFGFDADAAPADGQIWTITDEAGNQAYVGDASTGSTAISNGFNGNGAITYAYDSADRRFTYSYTTLNGTERLTQVKAETKTSGTWANPSGVEEVAKVQYEYYGDESHGDIGDLKLVEITTPLSDSGVSSTKKRYYRYWEGSSDGVSDYDASTNPGYVHHLRLVLDFEGCRNYDYSGDQTFNESFLAASQGSLEAYAAAYLEYDGSQRVDLAWFQGDCGCSGAGDGTHEYEYETNGSYSDDSGYDTEWAMRTVVQRPDGTYVTEYFDEVHQPSHSVVTDDDPDNTNPAPSVWPTHITRDSAGAVRKICTPANIDTYTHSSGSWTTHNEGLQVLFNRENTDVATYGFLVEKQWRNANTGSWTYWEDTSWTSQTVTIGDSQVDRPVVDDFTHYIDEETSSPTSGETWDSTTTFYSSSLAIEQIDTDEPTVSTGNNGSNSAVTSKRYFNQDGTLAFEKSGTGIVTYREYSNGQLTKLIRDADTTKTSAGEDFENVTIPTGFASSGSPLHAKTETTYDPQGRRDQQTDPGGKIDESYISKLADERMVRIAYPKVDSTPKWWGPAMATVTNHAGRAEAQMTVAISGGTTTTAQTGHVDETDDDPITAMDLGSVAALTMNVYSEDGHMLEESRLYHDVPASGAGADETNYDPTHYGYDDSGRRWRTKAPHGTITRTVFDARGMVSERWMGRNDSSFSGGEPSGTDDMVKVEELEYDDGADQGNGHLTERTLHLDDSGSNTRVTAYTNDPRGRLLLQTNPTAPHALHSYDNVGQRLATALYSRTTNITAGTTDPAATGTQTDRLALTTWSYDERGGQWRSKRYEIDASDGSDDDFVETLHWFDGDHRLLKTEGSQLVKMTYDGLGRVTHRFVLASDDDTGYSDADDVTGDIVLEESQTVHDGSTGDVLLSVRIDREHDDAGGGQTTGALDSNADGDRETVTAGNLSGRAQIVARWYDDLDRVEDEVVYGSNGGSTLAYPGSPPARSATELRITYTYGDDGRVETVQDPRGLKTKSEYDDAGRMVAEIGNYDPAVNSGNPSGTDDNVTVEYTYKDGLMTRLTAATPSGDQETIYIYNTTNGDPAASEISTGHLLRAIAYPDCTNTGTDMETVDEESEVNSDDSDVVSFAYNAQGEQVEKKDQAGNVFATVRDDSGRTTNYKWTTAVGDFDTAVRRIERTYDTLGRPDLVTQYDAVSSGSVVDEAGYTYDDWGNVASFAYDRDSEIDAGGSDDEYIISYSWAKATGGRNTVRKTGATFPSGNAISYTYSSSSSNDSDASRVTEVKDGATSLAAYEYLGAGTVVGTTYDEPDSFYKLYESTNDYDARLDRFNRVTESTWTKDLATDRDFYSVTVDWDENGNVTSVEDHVHVGFDVKYDIDEIDRVTRAEEGTLSGGSITSQTRDQQWTLDHVGNWDHALLDLDGDANYNEAGEYDDDRTHNDVNELEARDVDDSGSDDYSLTYDAVGNLTDDDEEYEYVWDGFGRLRKIKDTSDQSLIAEYKYNGLGFLTAVHEDTDTDGDVDGDDKWFYRMYDERWRWIGTFRESDTDPKEEYIPHQAGADGRGGSSYIDLVILRDRDGDNLEWTDAADGTMEERIYYCQNWRADVSAIVEDSGEMVEWVKYSAYGVPFGLPRGDTDSDGDCDQTDRDNIDNWSSGYDVRYDIDLGGTIDDADESEATSTAIGLGEPSSILNTLTYAGMQLHLSITLSRSRKLASKHGRWISRDSAGYADGASLYEYAASDPVASLDPSGKKKIKLNVAGDSAAASYSDAIVKEAMDAAVQEFKDILLVCCFEHDCPELCFVDVDVNPGGPGGGGPGGSGGGPGGTPGPASGGGGGKGGGYPKAPTDDKYDLASESGATEFKDGSPTDNRLINSNWDALGDDGVPVILTIADIEIDGVPKDGASQPGEGILLDIFGSPLNLTHELGHYFGYLSHHKGTVMGLGSQMTDDPNDLLCKLFCDAAK